MKRYLLFIGVLLYSSSGFCQAKLSVASLTCEYNKNPLGIESSNPRLSWIIESSVSNTFQTAYQVLESNKKEVLQQNQGIVLGDASPSINYNGKEVSTITLSKFVEKANGHLQYKTGFGNYTFNTNFFL